MSGRYPTADLDLGGLRLRTLDPRDAALLVEATRAETAPALWGPRPAGPYSPGDAATALREWDPGGDQVSFALLRGERMLAALGLMADAPGSAELAYWVRPEQRGRGLAVRAVRTLTAWAYEQAGLLRAWLEIEPGNGASLGVARSAGYRFQRRLPAHCRSWVDDDPDRDEWHDCLIYVA